MMSRMAVNRSKAELFFWKKMIFIIAFSYFMRYTNYKDINDTYYKNSIVYLVVTLHLSNTPQQVVLYLTHTQPSDAHFGTISD